MWEAKYGQGLRNKCGCLYLFAPLDVPVPPVVIGCAASADTIIDFGSNDGGRMRLYKEVEGYSHSTFPLVLDWTEQPPGEIILRLMSVSRAPVEGRVGQVKLTATWARFRILGPLSRPSTFPLAKGSALPARDTVRLIIRSWCL